MRKDEFHIGGHFTTGPFLFRCTDTGTRTVCAIRVDEVEIAECRVLPDGTSEPLPTRRIDPRKEDPSWLNGPPYAVAETCFDEYDQEGCTDVPNPDDWTPEDSRDDPEGVLTRA